MHTGFAAVKQRDLREMVFSMPRLLESVGQNLGSNPKLLGKVLKCCSPDKKVI